MIDGAPIFERDIRGEKGKGEWRDIGDKGKEEGTGIREREEGEETCLP